MKTLPLLTAAAMATGVAMLAPTEAKACESCSSLNGNATYYWQITTNDANGDSAQVQVTLFVASDSDWNKANIAKNSGMTPFFRPKLRKTCYQKIF